MRSKVVAEDEAAGGLSPNARLVYISTDMLARWRLDKSIALDNARWALSLGRRDIAANNVRGARFAHLQIMRIKARLRSRSSFQLDDLQRLDQRITELRNEKAEDSALEARADGHAAPGGRQERDADRKRLGRQRQNRVDVPLARAGEAPTAGRINGRDARSGGGGSETREVQPARKLTPRLREVAILAAQDLSNHQIAERIQQTVANAGAYVSMAKKALGLSTRADFAAWAARETPAPCGSTVASAAGEQA